MSDASDAEGTAPVFASCPRCAYSLRGLPARHACPECGLRYDEQSGLYPAANPKAIFVIFLGIFGGGWSTLRYLPHLGNLAGATVWQLLGLLCAMLWIPFVIVGAMVIWRRYRRGFHLAITTDGLYVRLPGWDESIIPWCDIESATHLPPKKGHPHRVRLTFTTGRRPADLGGVCNIFPRAEPAERFVEQVTGQIAVRSAPHAQ